MNFLSAVWFTVAGFILIWLAVISNQSMLCGIAGGMLFGGGLVFGLFGR